MKVYSFIKTVGLTYDDRLRKETITLRNLGFSVKIIALEEKNESSSSSANSVHVRTISLASRKWFKQKKGLAVKTIELYLRFILYIVKDKPDIIWLHDLVMWGLVPIVSILKNFGVVKKIIWDHHELPSDSTLTDKVKMILFCWCMNLCDVIIMANKERVLEVQKICKKKINVPIKVIENYPDESFYMQPTYDLPMHVKDFLDNRPYVLAQGGAVQGRHFDQLADAIMNLGELALVVIGPYTEQQKQRLYSKYSREWERLILLAGYVPQLEVVPFIDHSIASVIFYDSKEKNRFLCAPNRLYQALSRGIPLIVSTNPPMANIVKDHRCGVIVDPSDINSIRNGIALIINKNGHFKASAKRISHEFRWEPQAEIIGSSVFS